MTHYAKFLLVACAMCFLFVVSAVPVTKTEAAVNNAQVWGYVYKKNIMNGKYEKITRGPIQIKIVVNGQTIVSPQSLSSPWYYVANLPAGSAKMWVIPAATGMWAPCNQPSFTLLATRSVQFDCTIN
jgi:hypothetical protein